MNAGSVLRFPFDNMPDFGEVVDIADGIKWLRIPLPYRLDHVNIYLLRDHDGWAVIDTGIKTDDAIAAWEVFLEVP
ncbi:MBL fold metallo-hydrolase [Rhodobacteraceae bacterium D3-12]|nr:MBL fold metallo-hydrolase [Rhodobacteraceae bacterium D3-12]